MKAGIGTAVLLIICILACGCTSEKSASPATKNQTIETPGMMVTALPAAGPVLATLSDSHPDTTLSLDPGVIVVSFQAKDVPDMHIVLLSKGTQIPNNYAAPVTFRMNGTFNGSIAFRVPEKEEYWLNVTSWGGTWNADVTRLSSDNPMTVPLNFTGPGMMATPMFSLEKGAYIFDRNGTGLTSPWYFLYYANGTPLMDANNTNPQPDFTVDSPRTFRIVTIPESGNYFLQVYADTNPNPWSASIVVAPTIPVSPGAGPVVTQSGNTGSPK